MISPSLLSYMPPWTCSASALARFAPRKAGRYAWILVLWAFAEGPLEAQQDRGSLHAAAQLTVGGTDADYPSCHGRILVFAGVSVEIGSPYFAEGGLERVATGGDDCAPAVLDESGNFMSPLRLEPGGRYWLGGGRRFHGGRLLLVGRMGALSSDEFLLSAKSQRACSISPLDLKSDRFVQNGCLRMKHSSTAGVSLPA